MSVIPRAKFSLYTPGNCSVSEGCTVTFDVQSQFQYFPSNSTSYCLIVDGTVDCIYEDNSIYVANNLYTNTWSSYIDPWDYSKSVKVLVSNGSFLRITTENVTTSQCTFQAARIVNNEVSHTTNKKMFLYVRGENFLVNGEEKRSPNSTNGYIFSHLPGNTATYTVAANSTPVTVVAIEVN